LRSSGVLRSVRLYTFTDISGQSIDPTFKDPEVQEENKKARKLEPVRCPETSVKVYNSTLSNTSE
jgi:hypothetical protein